MKMQISVVVADVRSSKGMHYGNFLFPGGSISIRITDQQYLDLKNIEGQQVLGSFALKVSQIVRFNRSFTVFEPSRLLDYTTDQGEGGQYDD